jgi:hypothetical protein
MMIAVAHVITFRSARFDIATETPNPINSIAGQSLLRWLGEQLRESRPDDPLSATIERLVRHGIDAADVEVEREG